MVKQFEKLLRKGKYLVPESRNNSHGGYRINRDYYGSNDSDKLKIIHVEKYTNLYLYVITNPNEREHEGYKYLVTSGPFSNRAFRTENGLKRFLKRTGLKKSLIERSSNGVFYRLLGSYERIYMSGNWRLLNEFGKKKGLSRTKVLDNGSYTTGYYDGKGKIYLLNTNYPRTIYNYFYE